MIFFVHITVLAMQNADPCLALPFNAVKKKNVFKLLFFFMFRWFEVAFDPFDAAIPRRASAYV
jgi:hypothetical protein